MKIADSNVSMTSTHESVTHVSAKRAQLEVKAEKGAKAVSGVAAIFDASGGSMVSAMEKYQKQEDRIEAQERKAQEWANAQKAIDRMHQPQQTTVNWKDIFEDMRKQLMDRLLELLNGVKGAEPLHLGEMTRGRVLDLRGPESREADIRSQLFGTGVSQGPAGTSSGGTLWQRVTAVSGSRTEYEHTTFQSQGFAVTEDERSLSFDVELSMSRSFTQKYEALTAESFIMTDPLVINLDSNITSVSDVKFKFDLDNDGEEEEISFAGEGSGFLALDINGNGTIDDGSELFGTKSGDGFADLAAYDEDGNHWIDENDAVYSQLRVWTRDADGNDKLVDLKEANVGAIYLGSVSTEFSLKDAATNETNAVIRKTGVYLRESGEVGTLSHVDLRC